MQAQTSASGCALAVKGMTIHQCKEFARAIEPLLDLFAANRRHVEQLLQHIPDAWQRTILIDWPEKQEQITVRAIIEMQTRHAQHHLDEILAIRKTHGY